MASHYEFWLTDDGGNKIYLMKNIFFATYTRVVSGLGTLQLGMAFDELNKAVKPYFSPDRRVEVWRSPADDFSMRREDVFVLRKPEVYTRQDNTTVIQFFGRNGADLLNRRWTIQKPGTSYTTKTDQIDDMMKAIVREQMLYGSAVDENGTVSNARAWPQNEFKVQADAGLGPQVTRNFSDRKVYDILKDLKDASLQLHRSSSSNRKVYFDVVPIGLSGITGAVLGWEFRTYPDLRGTDRTALGQFSLENENIDSPDYAIDYMSEVNNVYVKGNGYGNSQTIANVEDTTRENASRWNRCEGVLQASNETSTIGLQDSGRGSLEEGRPKESMAFTFLNVPGGENVPRSLYGLDWDLGDLVTVSYAGKSFEAEIMTVYVSLDDKGKETVTGRNVVNG